MSKEALRADTIYRIDRPDRRTFQRAYVVRRRPVVINGLCARWPALDWDLERLRRLAGTEQVDVCVYPDGDFYDEKTALSERMQMADYLDAVSRPPEDKRRAALITQLCALPRLERDVTIPVLFEPRAFKVARLDVRRDPVSPNRFHPFLEYLLCQLHGERRAVLFPPSDTPNLYPEPLYTFPDSASSMLDLAHPDHARYPKLARLHPVEVVLRPGETLYVPLHWWVWVTGRGLSIAVDFFWRASPRSWRPSAPALRVAAGYPIEKLCYRWSRLRGAGGR